MNIEIRKSSISGNGLFCVKKIKVGELIFSSRGVRTLNRSTSTSDAELTHRDSISIDENTIHIPLPNDFLCFVNHSCEPNCYVDQEINFYAKKTIMPGQEITIDYSFVDADIFWRMHHCACNKKTCRNIITSSFLLDRNFFIKNLPYIPKKIRMANARFYGVNQKTYGI